MIVSLIAAVAVDGTIGNGGQLPWSIADDMRFFTTTTSGHVVITGRKNFEAMGGPLPHRTNLVLSRNLEYIANGARVFGELPSALRFAEKLGESEVFIIGGAELYEAAKPYAHRFYLTRVLARVGGDTKYFDDAFQGWQKTTLSRGEKNDVNEHAFCIELWSRATPDLDYKS
jgi:dihydrofolate reductase